MIVFGHEDVLAPWAATRMPVADMDFGACQTMGFSVNDELLAVVVFHNFRQLEFGNDIDMSFAADSPKWCTRGNLRSIFLYPFGQLGCVRVTAVTGKTNKRARRLVEGVGFKREGVARRAMDGRENAFVYGMLKKECRWIKD